MTNYEIELNSGNTLALNDGTSLILLNAEVVESRISGASRGKFKKTTPPQAVPKFRYKFKVSYLVQAPIMLTESMPLRGKIGITQPLHLFGKIRIDESVGVKSKIIKDWNILAESKIQISESIPIKSVDKERKLLELAKVQNLIENDLAKTKTSKKADRLTLRIERKLTAYLDLFRKEIGKRSYYEIKQQYQKEIHNILRFGIEDAYFQGLDYSDKAIGQRQPVTVRDIDRINMMVQQAENRFWGLVAKAEPVKEFSFSFFVSAIATLVSDIITKSLNIATLGNLEPIEPIDYQSNVQVMFVTRDDEKVCPICQLYANNVYDIDDSSKPEIPEDTHHNCRCRYIVYQNGKPIIEAKK